MPCCCQWRTPLLSVVPSCRYLQMRNRTRRAALDQLPCHQPLAIKRLDDCSASRCFTTEGFPLQGTVHYIELVAQKRLPPSLAGQEAVLYRRRVFTNSNQSGNKMDRGPDQVLQMCCSPANMLTLSKRHKCGSEAYGQGLRPPHACPLWMQAFSHAWLCCSSRRTLHQALPSLPREIRRVR